MTRHFVLVAAFLFLICAPLNAQSKQPPMTNADVVKMVQAGMSENAIISAIQGATPGFDMTSDAIAALKAQKVPDGVIKAMATRQAGKAARPKVQAPGQQASSRASGPKWEIEFHGGKMQSYHTGGTGTAPPSAVAYSLVGSGFIGNTSVRVSSWYFGDGAPLIGLSSTLDPVLTSSVVQPQGKVFGFRASRTLAKRIAAEFTLDRSDRVEITKNGLDQIEAARASFKNAWGRLDTVPGNSPTSSVSTVYPNGGHQIFATGAAVIDLFKAGRVRPYVTAGGGLLSESSSMPNVTLVGSYGGPNALEIDTVHLSYTQPSNHVATGVIGAGIKISLTSHLGIRLDARAYLYRNPFTNLLDANHLNTPDAAWVVKATGGTSVPFLQELSGPGLAAYSTLSGPAISGLQTYVGSGTQRQLFLTLGCLWRF
jgi:hypothetical protein